MNKKPLIAILITLIIITLIIIVVVIVSKKSSSPNIISSIISEVKISQMQGLKIEILREGNGVEAKKDDRVIVNYAGTFKDGTQFDSSFDRNEPLTFVLGENRVIAGWEMGVSGMKMGEKRRLIVPASLAYGKTGRPPVIPPNTPLIFEIELLGILVK